MRIKILVFCSYLFYTCNVLAQDILIESHNDDWKIISTSNFHVLGIKNDGSLWAWGVNTSGQLGNNSLISDSIPQKIGTDNDWISISANYNNSFAIKANGTLWAWGGNSNGQLGNRTNLNSLKPVQIGTDTWLTVEGNSRFTLGIKSDSTLWAWGDNSIGEFGDSTYVSSLIPKKIGIDKWRKIEVGDFFSIGIKNDGTLWSWGNCYYGVLGSGIRTDRIKPAQIGKDIWKEISSNSNFTLAIKNDGTLWAWGSNDYGQLGNGSIESPNIPFYLKGVDIPVKVGLDSNWIKVSAGDRHSLAIKSDSTLWAWGTNYNGEYGVMTPKHIVGGLYGSTYYGHERTPYKVGTEKWKSVSAGNGFTIGLKKDNRFYCASGNNGYGQLGLNTTKTKYKFSCCEKASIYISDTNLCKGSFVTVYGKGGYDSTDNVYSWDNGVSNGEQFVPNSGTKYTLTVLSKNNCLDTASVLINTNSLQAPQVTIESNKIIVCEKDILTLNAKGALQYTWTDGIVNGIPFEAKAQKYVVVGTDANGCKNSNYINVNTKPNLNTVAFGNNIYASQKNAHYQWLDCSNNYNFLANDTNQILNSSKTGNYAVEVNTNGCIDTSACITFLPIVSDKDEWKEIKTGINFTLGLKTNGTLWAWGDNTYNQFGDGTKKTQLVPTQIDTASNWETIAAGNYSSWGIKKDGTLWAWGYNANGELGLNDTLKHPFPAQIGNEKTWKSIDAQNINVLALKADGSIWEWGQLDGNYLSIKKIPSQVGNEINWINISAGSAHSLAMKSDSTLWSWGFNESGQLGDSTTVNKFYTIKIPNLNKVKSFSAGRAHSLVITSTGELWSWGDNRGAQLGNGTVDFYMCHGDCSGKKGVFYPKKVGSDTDWASVSANHYSAAIKSNGNLYEWGLDSYDFFGLDSSIHKVYIENPTLVNNEQWSNIECGNDFYIGIKKDRSIYCAVGKNLNGQLGDNTLINRTTYSCFDNQKVGSEEDAHFQTFFVYPNPSNGHFTVKATLKGKCSLFNQMGQFIQSVQLEEANNLTASFDNLNAGVYFVVGNFDGIMMTRKVIVNK